MKKQFQKFRIPVIVIASAIVLFTSCKKSNTTYGGVNNTPPPINSIVKISSGDSLAVVPKINEFRLLAGDPLNSAPGAIGGRREINWDAVPANLTNTNNFPLDFFGSSDPTLPNGRKRGLLYENPAAIFQVDSTSFAGIDASYATQFEPFSKKRLFASLNTNVINVNFKVPGTLTDAYVKAFGVVFTDVDDANSTSIEYFNGNKSLGVFKVPVRTAGGSFSFLGVSFPDEKVTKVRITSGNGILGAGVKDISNGGTKDLVVMDDLIYDEPKAQ